MKNFILKATKIKPLYDVVYKVVMLICKLLLIADIAITTYIVLARYITVIPAPNWGEEIILTLMCYMAVLSASLAIRRNAHIRMTSFDRKLPKTVVKVSDLIADLAVFALALVMVIVGFRFAFTIGARGMYNSLPHLSRFWMYFPIPLAGIAMIFFEVERIFIDLGRFVGLDIKTGLEDTPVGANSEELKKEEEAEAAAKAAKKAAKEAK